MSAARGHDGALSSTQVGFIEFCHKSSEGVLAAERLSLKTNKEICFMRASALLDTLVMKHAPRRPNALSQNPDKCELLTVERTLAKFI